MTTLELLYVIGAVSLALVGAVPAVRARRRWRSVLRIRQLATPQLVARVRPLARTGASKGRWPMLAAAGCAGVVGFVVGGPVGGAVLACYGVAGTVLWTRRYRRRLESEARLNAVDAVAGLAAQLRAGVAVGPALADVQASIEGPGVVGAGALAVRSRLAAALELAETSGAPLADVLDRLDAHLRATERARATAQAQAAGALASAGLLAVMPVAGAGLGILVGLNPAHILLHTPIGAACLCAAVALQMAGLAWSSRISRIEVTA